MNLAEHLDRAALLHGRRPAVRGEGAGLDYRALASWSVHAAALLAEAGVRPDDRVVLLLPHTIDFAAWYYGVLRLGAVVVALDPAAPAHAHRRQLRQVGARVVVTGSGPAETAPEAASEAASEAVSELGTAVLDAARLRQVAVGERPAVVTVERSDDDVAVVAYTSGTTAMPKAAALTHGNLAHDALRVAQDVLELTEDDVVLGLLPFHGVFGQTCVLNAAVLAGASVALASCDDACRAWSTMVDDVATVLVGVPSILLGLVDALHATPPPAVDVAANRLRVCLCGGAALPLSLLLDLERLLDCVVLEGYGLTEAAPVVSANRIDHRRLGSVGLPLDGVEVRVAAGEDAVGELLVRGRTVMAGYWSADASASGGVVDGWLHTGDLGRIDADGYLHVLDRVAEVVWRDGRAVYPREIEEVLYGHPAVREAAVVEVAAALDGPSELVAHVTLDPAYGDADDLLRDLRRRTSRLPAHARPARVLARAEMPRTRTGKILKRALRTAVEA